MKLSQNAIEALCWIGVKKSRAELMVHGLMSLRKVEDKEIARFVFDRDWIREEIDMGTIAPKKMLSAKELDSIVKYIHEHDNLYCEGIRRDVLTVIEEWLEPGLTLEEYKAEVVRLSKLHLLIDITQERGIVDKDLLDFMSDGKSPEECVRWYGERDGLTWITPGETWEGTRDA